MRFTKMQGAGNDYIYVNCFDEPMPSQPADLARRVSDRHFGIGGDGLIFICPSDVADARMRMFNADGSEAEMCGNGIRCMAKYLYDHGLSRKPSLRIETGAGILTLDLEVADGKVHRVRVDMGEPILEPARVPTLLPGNPRLAGGSAIPAAPGAGTVPIFVSTKMGLSPLTRGGPDVGAAGAPAADVELNVGGQVLRVTCVSMGNPHCVTFVDQLSDHWVLHVGPQVEIDPRFPNRVNAEFVEVLSPAEVRMRVWERGSGETLACGTGACAVCVAGALTGRTARRILAHLPGGDLELHWADDNHVYKTGPAVEVFEGVWG